MRARVNTKALAHALKVVAPAVGKPGRGLPVLAGVRIEQSGRDLTLQSSNLDMTITTTTKSDGEDGVVIPPAALFARIVGGMKAETIEIVEQDGKLTLTAGDATAEINTLDATAWPKLNTSSGKKVALFGEMLDAIDRVAGFASIEDSKGNLQGLHFEAKVVTVTDSFRAAIVDVGVDLPTCTVPAEAIRAALGFVDSSCTFSADHNLATFATDDSSWSVRLLPGDYPKMEQFFTVERPIHLVIPKAPMLEALARMGLLEGQAAHVTLTVDGGKARLVTSAPDIGTVTDIVPCEGELGAAVMFNGGYLAEMVVAAGDVDEITFELQAEFAKVLKPVMVQTDRVRQMLMPTRPGLKSK